MKRTTASDRNFVEEEFGRDDDNRMEDSESSDEEDHAEPQGD